MVWTRFWDMHSGGGSKEKWEHIYIEAPVEEARVIFYNRFGHSPDRVSCTCCGADYAYDEFESLEQASGYHRNCAWDKDGGYIEKARKGWYIEKARKGWEGRYISLRKYLKDPTVHVIRARTIKKAERKGEIPEL